MAVSKQCSKCGEGYDFDLNTCPGCGYQGYRLVEISTEAAPPLVAPSSLVAVPPPPARVESAVVAGDVLQAPRVLAWMACGLMLASLFMVWAQASIAAITYFGVCQMVTKNLNDAMNLGGARVLAVFIPGVAAFGVLVGATTASQKTSAKQGFSALLVAGLVAAVAAWQVYDYANRSGGGVLDLTGALGPGFQLYTGAAIAVVAVGLWGVLSAPMEVAAGGASPVGIVVDQFVAFAQKHRMAFISAGALVALSLMGLQLYPVFKHEQDKAQLASCTSNMKQIALAVQKYEQDFDEKMPRGDWCNTSSRT